MINITGASDGRVAPIIAEILEKVKGQSLIVVPTFNKAKRLATSLSFLLRERYSYCLRRRRCWYSMKHAAMKACP